MRFAPGASATRSAVDVGRAFNPDRVRLVSRRTRPPSNSSPTSAPSYQRQWSLAHERRGCARAATQVRSLSLASSVCRAAGRRRSAASPVDIGQHRPAIPLAQYSTKQSARKRGQVGPTPLRYVRRSLQNVCRICPEFAQLLRFCSCHLGGRPDVPLVVSRDREREIQRMRKTQMQICM